MNSFKSSCLKTFVSDIELRGWKVTFRDGVKHGSPAVLSGGVDVSHGKVLGERTLSRNSPDLKEGAEHIEPPTTQVKSQYLKVSQFPRLDKHTKRSM